MKFHWHWHFASFADFAAAMIFSSYDNAIIDILISHWLRHRCFPSRMISIFYFLRLIRRPAIRFADRTSRARLDARQRPPGRRWARHFLLRPGWLREPGSLHFSPGCRKALLRASASFFGRHERQRTSRGHIHILPEEAPGSLPPGFRYMGEGRCFLIISASR